MRHHKSWRCQFEIDQIVRRSRWIGVIAFAPKPLNAHKRYSESDLVQRFGFAHFALFGSFVRNRAGDDSDVDILVRLDGHTTSERYVGTQFCIEDLLGRPVDLMTDGALRRELRPASSARRSMSEQKSELRGWRFNGED